MGRGQVSIYVLLGVLVLIIVAVVLLLFRPFEFANFNNNPNDVNYIIDNCLEISLKQSIIQGAEKGFKNQTSIVFENQEFEYYLIRPIFLFPNITRVEEYLSKISEEKLNTCLQKLNELETKNEIKYFGTKNQIKINKNDVTINAELNITITSNNNQEFTNKNYAKKINYPLMETYQILNDFMTHQQKNQEYFQISYLADLAYKNNLKYKINYANQQTIAIQLEIPDKTKTLNQNLIVRFALTWKTKK